jgi:hypothetical protein
MSRECVRDASQYRRNPKLKSPPYDPSACAQLTRRGTDGTVYIAKPVWVPVLQGRQKAASDIALKLFALAKKDVAHLVGKPALPFAGVAIVLNADVASKRAVLDLGFAVQGDTARVELRIAAPGMRTHTCTDMAQLTEDNPYHAFDKHLAAAWCTAFKALGPSGTVQALYNFMATDEDGSATEEDLILPLLIDVSAGSATQTHTNKKVNCSYLTPLVAHSQVVSAEGGKQPGLSHARVSPSTVGAAAARKPAAAKRSRSPAAKQSRSPAGPVNGTLQLAYKHARSVIGLTADGYALTQVDLVLPTGAQVQVQGAAPSSTADPMLLLRSSRGSAAHATRAQVAPKTLPAAVLDPDMNHAPQDIRYQWTSSSSKPSQVTVLGVMQSGGGVSLQGYPKAYTSPGRVTTAALITALRKVL